MFTKLTTALALFSVAAQVAVAAPPACLLAAVNTQDNPTDLATVCDSGAASVKKYLSSNCGDNTDAAMEAFQSTCKDAGVEVSTSSSASASKSSSGSHSATGYPTKSSSHGSSSETESASVTGTPSKSMSMAPYPIGTGASSGFSTATSNSTGYAAPSNSGSGSSPATPTESGVTSSTGGAARLGMDVVGLAAVGVFGAMLAL